MDHMGRVLLIRHGQTDWNMQRRWQGQTDIPLNDEGRQQANLLAEYLRDTATKIDLIYSSDLERAWETARPISAFSGVEIQTDPRLREIGVGLFEGLTGTEIDAKYPQEYLKMREDYLNFVFPQGESRLIMQTRAYAALEDVAADLGSRTAVLVTHGGVIAMLLAKLFPHDPHIQAVPINNTSITTLVRDCHTWRLETLAITPHLPE